MSLDRIVRAIKCRLGFHEYEEADRNAIFDKKQCIHCNEEKWFPRSQKDYLKAR